MMSDRAFNVTRRGLFIGSAALGIGMPAAQRAKSMKMPRSHQPGEDAFRAIRPEEVAWKSFPAFPPAARLAVIVGNPSEPGPYTIRVKLPMGIKMMPHLHPEDRVYTVISGIFYIGLGGDFDETELMAYSPGSTIVLPGGQSHFHFAKSGEYITQVTAIGPLGLQYVDPADDPRNASISKP